MTKQEEHYLNLLISEALTVNTDEIEGQQVIDLNNLDLCAADYTKASVVINDNDYDMNVLNQIYADPDIIKLLNTSINEIPNILSDIKTNTNIIIEFADATLNDPNPVYYKISVQPGELINNETEIGTIMQKGKMKTIKSIFEKGTVKGINDNTEYFHLYPSNCQSHIVLEDVLIDSNNFNISEQLLDLNDNFKKEGLLYALITNNLCQSLLPYILTRRYRGVYTRTFDGFNFSKWFLNSSDLSFDNTEISTFIKNKDFKNNKQYDTPYFLYDYENEQHDTGLKIYDSSVLKFLDDIQNEFGSKIIGNDVTKQDMKSWKKRAKKKRKRKKVKQEIKAKVQNSVNKIKHSENPYQVLNTEKDRLLGARNNYINDVINLYKNKDNLPLCKYDPEYNDCKFLVNNIIDEGVLENVNNYDEDFTYSPIGDVDNYYNYYFSLLGNLNLLSENEYVTEYYNLLTDIINKRLIIETSDIMNLKKNFCKLFNDNISNIFNFYQNEKYNTDDYINHLFTQFENKINVFVQEQNTKHANDIRDKFTKMELGEDAIENAGTLYTANNQYKQIYDYIKNLYTYTNDEDENVPNEIIALLSTIYTYIKSYGNGENNIYKDLTIENKKYLYLTLINEEALKLCDFWDKIILEYEKCTMENCLNQIDEIANQFDEYAEWPLPSTFMINNVVYKHYLFTNKYETEKNIDTSIGDYDFPETVNFPDIPDEITIDEEKALDLLKLHDVMELDDPNKITILDTDYWKKYFTLATLICLVPAYWNCGLDIMPFILFIQMPCIFIAIKSINLHIFNMIIVFGIAIRGMYPWPIILYINTSDQPVSILTPLVAAIDRLKTIFNQKINNLVNIPIKNIANFYIDKLNNEINDIKKENIKLDTYKRAIKLLKIPKATSLEKEFELIAHPDVDLRRKIIRLDELAKRSRV